MSTKYFCSWYYQPPSAHPLLNGIRSLGHHSEEIGPSSLEKSLFTSDLMQMPTRTATTRLWTATLNTATNQNFVTGSNFLIPIKISVRFLTRRSSPPSCRRFSPNVARAGVFEMSAHLKCCRCVCVCACARERERKKERKRCCQAKEGNSRKTWKNCSRGISLREKANKANMQKEEKKLKVFYATCLQKS